MASQVINDPHWKPPNILGLQSHQILDQPSLCFSTAQPQDCDFLLHDDPRLFPSLRAASKFLDLSIHCLLSLVQLWFVFAVVGHLFGHLDPLSPLMKSSPSVCQWQENCPIAIRLDATQASLWDVLHVAGLHSF